MGHCCLRIEENGATFLTDPGAYSLEFNVQEGIDVLFYTHEHQDHFHLESLRKLLEKNPHMKIVTNRGVAKLLEAEGITYELLENGQQGEFAGVKVAGHGEWHAPLHKTIPDVPNTGYFFAERFFYPGDQFTNPGKPVEILALPVVGPWLTVGQSADYAERIKPKVAFPVHDWNIKSPGMAHRVPGDVLAKMGGRWLVPELGGEFEV